MTEPTYRYVKGQGWVTTPDKVVIDDQYMVTEREPVPGLHWTGTNDPNISIVDHLAHWDYAGHLRANDGCMTRWRGDNFKLYSRYFVFVPL